MLKSREELKDRKIEIDLKSPQGNAYYLLGQVEILGKQLNIPLEVRKDIRTTMTIGNYEDLIKTFDIWFGDYVILYK
tara:strand:+ start:427 stop:657 length:231 start_codon:yes stop_codon:yes gene_type:complete